MKKKETSRRDEPLICSHGFTVLCDDCGTPLVRVEAPCDGEPLPVDAIPFHCPGCGVDGYSCPIDQVGELRPGSALQH